MRDGAYDGDVDRTVAMVCIGAGYGTEKDGGHRGAQGEEVQIALGGEVLCLKQETQHGYEHQASA